MPKAFGTHAYRIWEARPDMVEVVQSAQDPNLSSLFGEPQVIQRPQPTQRNVLYFSHTSGVEAKEAEGILEGIRIMIHEVGSKIQIKNFGAFHIHGGDYGSADWYQTVAQSGTNTGYGRQIYDHVLQDLFRKEPYQKPEPHMDFMVFDQDMTSLDRKGRPYNFVYGSNSYPHNILSVKRFRSYIEDPTVRQIALSVLAGHELGHNFGLVERNFNIREDLGFHCSGEAGPCLMEQVNTSGTRTLEAQAKLLVNRTRWLCMDCLDEASFKQEDLRSRGILW